MINITLFMMSALAGVAMATPLAKEEWAPDTLPYEHPGAVFRQMQPGCGGGVLRDGNSTGEYKNFGGSEFISTMTRKEEVA